MDASQAASPIQVTFGISSRTRSNTRLADDAASLTSFNPFSEEDENDQSSYTLVTSIFSRMKSSLTSPLSSAVSAASSTSHSNSGTGNEPKRPSFNIQPSQTSISSRLSTTERPNSLSAVPSNLAPPLVSLTPVVSEAPSYTTDSLSRGMSYSPDGGLFGTAIPGFPIPDDARSTRTANSLHRSGSVSKVIRRIRGAGNWRL